MHSDCALGCALAAAKNPLLGWLLLQNQTIRVSALLPLTALPIIRSLLAADVGIRP